MTEIERLLMEPNVKYNIRTNKTRIRTQKLDGRKEDAWGSEISLSYFFREGEKDCWNAESTFKSTQRHNHSTHPYVTYFLYTVYHQSIGKGTHSQLMNDTFQMHSWVDNSIILLTLKSARFTETYKRLEDLGISLCTLNHRDRIFYAGVKANTFIVVNTSVIQPVTKHFH